MFIKHIVLHYLPICATMRAILLYFLYDLQLKLNEWLEVLLYVYKTWSITTKDKEINVPY